MIKQWDLIVVGAGIIGVTVAWMARRLHHRNVLLIEQSLAGRGATAYALALRTPYFESAAMKALVGKSKRLYEEKVDRLPGAGSVRVPSFWVVPEQDREVLGGRLASDRLQEVSGAESQALLGGLPGLRLHGNERLMYDPDDCMGSPGKTSEALLQDFLRAGGTLAEGVRYASVQQGPQGVSLQLTDATRLSATQVVLATGPWMADDLRADPLPSVRNKKIVAFHIDQPPSALGPIVQWLRDDVFLAPDPARNRYLLSICSDEWDVAADESRLSITAAETAYARDFLGRYFPRLSDAIVGGRVFCDGYSRTSAPHVEEHPSVRGVCYAGGAGGAGYRLAPAIADEVMQRLGIGSVIGHG